MPSGKRAKQMRREAAVRTPPPVRSKGAPGGVRQASPRVLGLAALVVVVIGIVVALAVVFTRNSNGGSTQTSALSGLPKKGSATWKGALSGATEVRTLFKGIPEHGLTLGSPFAPATLTEFIDLQCPVCQDFETTMLPTLIQKYVRTGKLKITMQPWDILDRTASEHDSARGQAATIAASLQNKAFQFAEMLYLNQGTEDTGWLTERMVALAAASVDGLNPSQVLAKMSSSTVTGTVSAVDHRAGVAGFDSTPTLLLNKQGETPHEVANELPNLSTLESQIEAAAGG
jgi:protein-disulfide isomerase